MAECPLIPFQGQAGRLEQHCKLPLHTGTARVTRHGTVKHPLTEFFKQWQQVSGHRTPDPSEVEFDASFIVPASGNGIVFLQSRSASGLTRNFGEGLTITGLSADGPFTLDCPEYVVCLISDGEEEHNWAVGFPRNQLVTISYGTPRPIHKVSAILNNFDFANSNVTRDPNQANQGPILRIQAAGRTVEFAWRQDHAQLRRLVDARILPSTAFTTFSFTVWQGASEVDLRTFAHNIASLCAIVTQQHTGIPVLSFLDKDGRVIKRMIGNSIESEFREECIVDDHGLPQLFRQCFDEHEKMQTSKVWQRIPFYLAAIQDEDVPGLVEG